MPAPQDRPSVVWWRLGLLFALGGTILFASFSYDDWRAIARYLGSEVWQGAARRAAMSRDLREAQQRAARERREARIEGSIRGLFTGSVQALARCPDGGLVAGGVHSRHGLALARLRPDGTLDRAWTERAGAGPLVGGVDAISCDGAGLLVSGSLLSHRSGPIPVTAARFAPDGGLDRLYGDGSWLDHSIRERIASDLYVRVQRHLPALSRLRRVFAGPGASALASFDERLPEPPEPEGEWATLIEGPGLQPRSRRVFVPRGGLCGVGEELGARWVRRAALFDDAGRLVGAPATPEGWDMEAAEPQPGRGWIVRGRRDQSDDAPVIWRVNAAGRDETFRELRAQDLHGRGAAVLASLVEPDGRIVLGGTFDFIHTRPRSHIARLRADGTLDD
jgi:hypothetical protein